jgi:peptidoglycan/LPS O-acetylase OafA/YrhL
VTSVSTASGKSGYQPHIDGLRAVAVLAVLAFHAFPRALPGGFIGVDIFFVISGFLISEILREGFEDSSARGASVIGGFYRRRINRIFPALLVVMITCQVVGYCILMPGELVSLAQQTMAGGAFYLNLLLAGRTEYFSPDPIHNPLLHLWSLGVEEQFYLVWPLYLWIVLRCRIRFGPAVVFAAVFSFVWNAERTPATATGAFYLPQLRLWELALGAGVAALLPEAKSWQSKLAMHAAMLAEMLSLLGLALIAAGFVCLDSSMDLPNAWLLMPTVGAALVIVAGASTHSSRLLLAQRPAVWIGLLSYPLYLWHWPLLTFARLSTDNPHSPYPIAAALVLSLALAWLTYRFIERPVRRIRGSGRLAAGLLAGMALLIGWTWLVRKERGFPDRYPALLNEIAAYNHNPAESVRQGTYFLSGDQDETNFKVDPQEIDPAKHTLVLWGDSHAASLYPGLNAVYGPRLNIVQRTAAKTPPFVPEYFNPGQLRSINNFVLATIKRVQPEWVLVHANWLEYDWPQVEQTLLRLQGLTRAKIILVGPVPQWIGGLPHQLYNHARRHPASPVPRRMRDGLDPRVADVDQRMAALAARLGVAYISPASLLQDKDGTLVRTSDTADSLVTHDISHLTVAGSRFLVAKFPALD